MDTLAVTVVACFSTALVGVAASVSLTPRSHLGLKDSWISFAIGALAGTALLEALPHAWEGLDGAHGALSLLLVGAVCCLALDRVFHCNSGQSSHGGHCYLPDAHAGRSSSAPVRAILAGDFLHSIVDGSLIAAAFGTGPVIGFMATLAILVHEVPRKCATMLVLRRAGRSARRAMMLGALSSLGVVGGGIVASLSLATVREFGPLLLVVAASMMLYVALLQLREVLQSAARARVTARQAVFMFAGAMSVSATHWVVGVTV